VNFNSKRLFFGFHIECPQEFLEHFLLLKEAPDILSLKENVQEDLKEELFLFIFGNQENFFSQKSYCKIFCLY